MTTYERIFHASLVMGAAITFISGFDAQTRSECIYSRVFMVLIARVSRKQDGVKTVGWAWDKRLTARLWDKSDVTVRDT